jgi:hypothetical protein
MALEGKDSIVSPGLSGIEIIVFFFSSLASGSIPERLGDTCCQPSSALPSPASSYSLSFALIRRAERRGGREGRRFTPTAPQAFISSIFKMDEGLKGC